MGEWEAVPFQKIIYLHNPNKKRVFLPIFTHKLRHSPRGLVRLVLHVVRDKPVEVLEGVVPVDLYNTTVNRILVVPGLLTPPLLWEIIGADMDGSNL